MSGNSRARSKPRLIVIVGPTASGKTRAGVELARVLGGVVVSADSRQVYVGLSVGTAKPKLKAKSEKRKAVHDVFIPDVVGGIDHYLLNIREPDDELTLAEWQRAAFLVIDRLVERGATPLLVGGTMLYVDSVVKNYDIPQVERDEVLRARLEHEDVDVLYQRLLARDPAARAFVQADNKRRIIRALEVIEATGRAFSEQRRARASRYDVTMIGIFPGWEQLEKTIATRAEQMLAEGLLDETATLVRRYGRTLPLLQTINYRQALAVLRGEMTEEEALADMVRANRRYARRQMSWWRGRDEIAWFATPEEVLAARVYN